MFYDKEISILDSCGHFDANELWIPTTPKVIKTIECDVQPYTKELAYKDYNFNEEVTYRVFCEPDKLIKNSTNIAYREAFEDEDTILNVVKIIPWDTYWVLLINE